MKTTNVTKETDQRFDFSAPTRKTALLCCNGFQMTDIHDCTAMAEYFKNSFADDYPNCEIVSVSLFEPADKKTHKAKHFEEVLDETINDYIDKGYDIVLLGYSFSASLAAKLQVRYHTHIRKLILVAPVYDTIVNNMIPGYIKYVLKFRKLKKKYGKEVSKAMGRTTTKGMIGLLLSILRSVLKCRKYFDDVDCNTVIIRGTDDNLCGEHSIKKVRKDMECPNILYTYEKMNHGIMKSVRLNGAVFEDILHYSFGTPHLLQTNTTLLAAKPVEQKVKLDEDGQPIPTFADIFSEIDSDEDEYETYRQNEEAM